MTAPPLKPILPPGFKDLPHQEARHLFDLLQKVMGVYQRYGYPLLETPMVEYANRLGVWLPDEEQPLGGVFAWGAQGEESELALRYDLTAPLARYAAQHHQQLPKPFRRAQWGYVFRNDKPGTGRLRQFMQVDADIVGAPGVAGLAELCLMTSEALMEAGLPSNAFSLRLNDRRLLDGVLAGLGIEKARLAVLRAIDKKERLGLKGVADLLGEGRKDVSGDFTKGAGLTKAQINGVMAFLGLASEGRGDFLQAVASLTGMEACGAVLEELAQLDRLLCASEEGRPMPDICFDAAIVRGLGYYSGLVFEAVLVKPPKGFPASIAAGGAYDGLLARFARAQTGMEQGVGTSIGLTRLAELLPQQQARGSVMVAFLDEAGAVRAQAMADELRRAGLPAHVYPGQAGLKAQFKYADKSGVPFVLLEGEDEMKEGQVMVKNMAAGAAQSGSIESRQQWQEGKQGQQLVARAELVQFLRARLTNGQP